MQPEVLFEFCFVKPTVNKQQKTKKLLPTQSKTSIAQSSEGDPKQQSCESDSRTMSSNSMQDFSKASDIGKLTHIN